MTKMLSKHWNERYVGKQARVVQGDVASVVGTLCGYVANDGVVTRLLVAYTPDDRREYAVADVELA